MKGIKRVKVTRHSKFFIVLHWLIVTEMVVLLVTGFSLSEGFTLFGIERGTARPWHIVAGLLWLATVVFFLYYFVMSREYDWFRVSRIGYALDFFVEEARAFLSGKRVHEPIKYDRKAGEYVEKIIPTEVLAWWGWFALWLVIGLSGLALLFPDNFGLVNRIAHFFVADYDNPAASTRVVHFLVALFIVVLGGIHIYAAFVFDVWKSIFFGTREEPVAE